jgi:hypothetical protein
MRKILLGVAVVAGCGGGGNTGPDATPAVTRVLVKDIPASPNPNLDLLFVIDNSGSMKEEQAGLAVNFPRLVDVLSRFEGGLPDLHIGVVSSDLGAGANNLPGCAGSGDAGRLLQGPPGTTCAGLDAGAKFLADVAGTTGRVRNYTGTMSDLFSCMASIGTSGCGIESHLEAMRTALDPATSANAGFLRAGAALGIVILGDEDDCSARDTSVFAPADTAKGPINFRCTEYGIVCDGDADPLHLQTLGARTNCHPREDSAFLHPVARYVDFVKALKTDPRAVVIGDIAGPPTPVAIVVDPTSPTQPALGPSCESVNGTATPAIRRAAFAAALTAPAAPLSICNTDLADPITAIGDQLRDAMGDRCIGDAVQIADADPVAIGLQPDCVASVIVAGTETPLPACTPAGPGGHAVTPCWYLEADATACNATITHLALRTDYGTSTPGAGARLTLRCAAQ